MTPEHQEAVHLLEDLIRNPSISKEEKVTADLIQQFLEAKGMGTSRVGHNVIAKNTGFDPAKPTVLLNSHHDTVKPNEGYSRDPHEPSLEEGRLYGLGSNDAGGALVGLISAFIHFYPEELPCNLVLAATAEEEISGPGGVSLILDELGPIQLGIVGEPTSMKMAVAEKGLMVLDCVTTGQAGHAARNEGVNAIYKALPDLEWFRTYRFPRESAYLGPVRMTVAMVEGGYQHNVVPDQCRFVVDVRTTDAYSNEDTLAHIRSHVKCEVKARSTRLSPSGLAGNSAFYQVARDLGIETYGSPTLSDQALMPFETIKIGPGDSARSHTADEFIYISELNAGISGYIEILQALFKSI